MNAKDRHFIEENIISQYQNFKKELKELENEILYASPKHDELGIPQQQTNLNNNDTERRAIQLLTDRRLNYLRNAIRAIEVTYAKLNPRQQKFMEMYYFSDRRYSWYKIMQETGINNYRTFGRWRSKISKLVAREMGMKI